MARLGWPPPNLRLAIFGPPSRQFPPCRSPAQGMPFLEGSICSARLRVRDGISRYFLHYASAITLVMEEARNAQHVGPPPQRGGAFCGAMKPYVAGPMSGTRARSMCHGLCGGGTRLSN